MAFVIEEELKKLPKQPGVYIMHDSHDEIIYVGKAVNLRNRVHQYFQEGYRKSPKITRMVSHIAYFEYIVTDSELEALVLENNLIKENRPKYNTMLKDDKTYPYIKVTVGEAFPRVVLTRRLKKDKSRYFGPFSAAGAVRDTIDMLHKTYHIRTCDRRLPEDIGKGRPCLNHHIHMCDAPCQGYISREDYRKNIDKVLEFLEGRYATTIDTIKSRMEAASEAMDFEAAAGYRDMMNAVLHVAQKQKITNSKNDDHDVIAAAKDDREAVIQIFFVRDGKMIGREKHFIKAEVDDTAEMLLESFIKQFYADMPLLPREIWIEREIPDHVLIEQWLSGLRGSPVHIVVPKTGSKHQMVEMAHKNAVQVLTQDADRMRREQARTTGAVQEICELLDIEEIHRMESYDISNTSGVESVASMVVYTDGQPNRSHYRKFRIKTVAGPDDYASMREVLIRRFTHDQAKKDLSFNTKPDILMIDGGKGQVHAVLDVLAELGINIPVCGMVKDDRHRTRGLFYKEQEVPIKPDSEAFKLVTRIQDETHRFAIEYHRSLRQKDQIHSVLDDINGIGPARRKALMLHYKSIDAIRMADEESLTAVDGMNRASARAVYEFFHPQEPASPQPPQKD
jgi:excinuclease ABC subunit C